MNSKILLPSVLFTALLAASQMAVAQDASNHANANANATADTATRANLPDAQLAERYAQLAGSTEAASELVGRLHGTTADGSAMAYGEIDKALALSGALVESGGAASFDTAVDTVTGLRAEGMGWGQVAQTLDVDLGAAVSAAHRVDVASPATGAANAGLSIAEQAQARVNGAVNGAAGAVNGAVNGVASGAADARTGVQRRAAADARVDAGVDMGVGARGATQERPAGAEVGVGIGVGVGASGRVDRPERPARPERGGLLGGGVL